MRGKVAEMSLSDRLAQAARQRAGLSSADPGSLLAAPASALREVSIVLGAHIPVAIVDPDPDVEADAVCPSCGRTGELGIVDLGRRTTDWSCVACGTLWRVTLPASRARFLR
jgi:hypothetical protein